MSAMLEAVQFTRAIKTATSMLIPVEITVKVFKIHVKVMNLFNELF